MADANTVRVTTYEVQAITAGNSNVDAVRTTIYEVQAITVGNSDIDAVRTTTYEIQAVSSIFNKTCIVAVSC